VKGVANAEGGAEESHRRQHCLAGQMDQNGSVVTVYVQSLYLCVYQNTEETGETCITLDPRWTRMARRACKGAQPH